MKLSLENSKTVPVALHNFNIKILKEGKIISVLILYEKSGINQALLLANDQ